MKSKDYYYVFDKDDLTIEVVRGKDIYNALNNGIQFDNVEKRLMGKNYGYFVSFPNISIYDVKTNLYNVFIEGNQVHIFVGNSHYCKITYIIVPLVDTCMGNTIRRGFYSPPILENNKLVMYVFTIKYGKFVFEEVVDCETTKFFWHNKSEVIKTRKRLVLGY